MKPVTRIAIIGTLVSLFGAGGIALSLSGVILAATDTHPPCDQLPSVAEATQRLAANQTLTNEIKALGDNITVEVGEPCPASQDRGLVSITYRSKAEREAITDLLNHRDGFGIPVHLAER